MIIKMAVKYNGIEKYIFSDIYNFFLKYKDVPNEDYYWKCIKDESNILCAKYKNHPFARKMIVETILQLEHVITGRKLDGMNHDEWENKLEASHKIGW